MEFKAQQIAQLIGGTIDGNADVAIHTFAKIEEGVEGALSFFYDPNFEPYVYETKSSIVLVPKDFQPSQPVRPTLIRVENPREALGRLLMFYESMKPRKKGISPQAYVAPTAKLGEDVYVAPFAYIGENVVIGDNTTVEVHANIGDGVKIGDDCIIYPNVTIYHDCLVGNRCILHAGAVIGADGFGFAPTPDGYEKIPQIGIAVLEDDVEIGANACIDRATMGSTIIHRGVKIDNLVQIGHNVEVDSHTVLCSQVGIAGSTKVGEWCTFTGQVGVAGHIKVADHTTLGAQSGLPGSVLKPGQTLMGYPAMNPKVFARATAVFKTLPDMAIQLRQLQKEVEAMKKQQ